MTRKWYDKNSKKWLDDIGEFTLKSKKQRNRMRTAPEYPWMVWKNHTKQLKNGGMGWKSPRWQEEAAKYSWYKLKWDIGDSLFAPLRSLLNRRHRRLATRSTTLSGVRLFHCINWKWAVFSEHGSSSMRHRGFEPRTTWLKVKCSTTWANIPYQYFDV